MGEAGQPEGLRDSPAVLRGISTIFAVFAATFVVFATVPAAFAAHRSASGLDLLQAVNAARKAYGLRPLRVDPTLTHAAEAHTSDMLRRDYFAHGNFPGRMAAFHVSAGIAGENLAWGSGPYGQAAEVVQEWLASPEHRANLLRASFSRIGVGLARGTFLGTGGATVVTADFAGN
jgi:uncharacterized protein YkwD